MVIQPSQAHAISKPVSMESNETFEVIRHQPKKNLSEVEKGGFLIDGISQKITISEVTTLWEHFNSAKQLHNRLRKQPGSVIVFYTDFSDNYQTANVTIGYKASDLKSPVAPIKVSKGKYTTLLKSDSYTNTQIAQSWSNINYQKAPNAVLEIHTLNANGETNSSELYVKYEEAK
ncbi:hypothetical protein PESP_b0498 [Pseudoalteromonas espejiana DSM 9414]|nr:hypothetical protein PESP_b0498 [Pseudoalteromonas espejiana DSM 9414]